MAADKLVVHIRNDSADGKAVEIAQARMRRWHDAGYAVAPIPGDGPSWQDHPQGVPCPICSPQRSTRYAGECQHCRRWNRYAPLLGPGRYLARQGMIHFHCPHCSEPAMMFANVGQRYQQAIIVTREQVLMDLDELRAHCKAMHVADKIRGGRAGQGPMPRDLGYLATWHNGQHYHRHLGHVHTGPFVLVADAQGHTTGRTARQLGYYTGEGAVTRDELRDRFLERHAAGEVESP